MKRNIFNTNSAYCFAALKLIEQLYRDGKITALIFSNILKDYADIVDVSEFIIGIPNKKEANAA